MTYVGMDVTGIMDFMPSNAKNSVMRLQLEDSLKQKLIQEIPAMVERVAMLENLITLEVEVNFMMEAREAFQYGLWRAAIGLIGIVAEKFTDGLYTQLKSVVPRDGKQISKAELLGERPSERSKLAILYVSGIISQAHYDKLVKIKELRNLYVHPQKKVRNAERDALTTTRLLRSVLQERFDKDYTIKQGKIVKR